MSWDPPELPTRSDFEAHRQERARRAKKPPQLQFDGAKCVSCGSMIVLIHQAVPVCVACVGKFFGSR